MNGGNEINNAKKFVGNDLEAKRIIEDSSKRSIMK